MILAVLQGGRPSPRDRLGGITMGVLCAEKLIAQLMECTSVTGIRLELYCIKGRGLVGGSLVGEMNCWVIASNSCKKQPNYRPRSRNNK